MTVLPVPGALRGRLIRLPPIATVVLPAARPVRRRREDEATDDLAVVAVVVVVCAVLAWQPTIRMLSCGRLDVVPGPENMCWERGSCK